MTARSRAWDGTFRITRLGFTRRTIEMNNGASVDTRTKQLVAALQSQCLRKGCGALKQLSCVFRRMDIDYSKRICFEELDIGCRSYNLNFSEKDLKILFSALDKDKNGQIDFKEFMDLLTPPMSDVRVRVINEAFEKLDVNGDGVIQVEDLQVVYAANARRHPKFISGEWTEEQTLRHFLDSLDTPGSPDGKVTRQEFMNYYAGVSVTVDDDCYFDMMMRSVYGLPAVSSRTKNAAKTAK
ncbi:calcyphosin-like protein [Biomphalaria glabrata]|uniref:Calcyphosin-like protein isoform X3 n=2 Tax=Biomphalaria TaxID=6525 RepID=A0A9W2ZNT0_BIOGL|nr:calcyphosin-like protein isoform X3 [Biomphalaria glabrata]XP_055876616.1 calcyphosin-like protein isoform X3 [Biomphalaria glabrata]XP_055876617.1 calcyphosin-like protein isoform X3 [Biomphalaria glabrata]XP_055876618.1 calcyphosin-like protein isoform X3 [Biomphalaria glabrata]KAI8765365.1 calcyphosin-like protein [Biomphalaria glabrata]